MLTAAIRHLKEYLRADVQNAKSTTDPVDAEECHQSRVALAHSHRRSPANQSRPRIHPRRSATADAVHRLHAVLPRRSGRCRQGHARHDPAASVHQGRACFHHHARAEQGRARTHARLRRGSSEKARSALSRDDAVRRRHGLCVAKDLRHRSLAARAKHVPRDFVVLDLRRVPGAAHECALSHQGGPRRAPCAHAQRLRRRRRPRADRGDGDLSAGRRLDCGARGAAAAAIWAA